jgi:ketosteroid isomerase-like protein
MRGLSHRRIHSLRSLPVRLHRLVVDDDEPDADHFDMTIPVGAPDRSTPEGLRAAWIAAITARDADGIRPLLADDYEVWSHGAPSLGGIEATVTAMRGALERYDVVQQFDSVETVIAGEWAFERGHERITVTPVGGGPPQIMTQRALLILRRAANGQWQFARGMTNALVDITASANAERPSE